MCELTLEADGYRADEANAARRLYDLTHDGSRRLPEWLARKGTWTPVADVPPQPEENP